MQIFFSSINALEHFTHALQSQPDAICPHCAKPDQWVSHGYIYKVDAKGKPVGKRILCANRYSKLGCGRTQALHLPTTLPNHRYGATQLLHFICALLAGLSISKAYYTTISHEQDARQAWRWVNRLIRKLGLFRQILHRPWITEPNIGAYHTRSRRLQILLPTLQPLYKQEDACEHFQLTYQILFL